jgi:hypothetical protein
MPAGPLLPFALLIHPPPPRPPPHQVTPPGGYHSETIDAGSGLAVGNKRFHFLSTGPIPTGGTLLVNATATIPGAAGVVWKSVAAYAPCT